MIILNRTEAKEEAEFLTKQSGREVKAARIDCNCDWDRNCGVCAGEGIVYELRYVFCDHKWESEDRNEECFDNFCREREAASVFPMESPQLPLHKPIAEEDREVA
jgi:hypothetical protein